MDLYTERLKLRNWCAADAEALFALATEPELGHGCGWAPHKNVEESRFIIENVFNKPDAYAICLAGTDTPIGSIELMHNGGCGPEKSDAQGEIGFWLGKPYWGNGYMPEAVQEMLRYAFEDLHMEAVWCCHATWNQNSARAQQKAGFTFRFVETEHFCPLIREYRDIVVNCLTHEEWEARQAK